HLLRTSHHHHGFLPRPPASKARCRLYCASRTRQTRLRSETRTRQVNQSAWNQRSPLPWERGSNRTSTAASSIHHVAHPVRAVAPVDAVAVAAEVAVDDVAVPVGGYIAPADERATGGLTRLVLQVQRSLLLVDRAPP